MDTNPDDAQHADILDDYLRRLHAGERPDRDRLLSEHPELDSALNCLELLDRIAPHGIAPGHIEPSGDDPQTQASQVLGDFGQYELLEEIGRGGMGVVYKARQKALDRTVAIKMVLAGHLGSPEHLQRFQKEARATARLQHPHIVHIHEVGQFDGRHFFAMQYVDGISLAQRIEQGPIEIDEAVRLLTIVADAVDHLHQQDIVHRDLKPSNILLDAQGQPHVGDFGLAKVFSANSTVTSTGVITGTPSYMSPEQAAGHNAQVGPASDIYSLGAILYELLTGRPPFAEDNPLDTLMQVLSREPVLPRTINPKIPRPLQLICLKCLAKSPQQRYASARALAEDLERFARGEPLQARPPSLKDRVLRWGRRQPALASRLGALSVFYVVEMFNYYNSTVNPDFHARISVLVAVWAVTSIVFQQFLDSRRWSIPARFGWGALDSVLFLAVLLTANGAASPLIIGYPLLIVASGLWFRVRFVSFMAVLSLISYGVLIVDFYYFRPRLQDHFDAGINRHVIFVVGLVIMAMVVAYLVHRLRTLSSYCERG